MTIQTRIHSTAGEVNVRLTPDRTDDTNILGKLSNGQVVTPTGRTNGQYTEIGVWVYTPSLSDAPEATASGEGEGFDWPVGRSAVERTGSADWSGYVDATGFLNRYAPGYVDSAGRKAWHTGADLNDNRDHWDADAGAPVFAVADGVVAYAGEYNPVWHKIVVIRHALADGSRVWSRYAHENVDLLVKAGEVVTRGQQIGVIGHPGASGANHLHFDIATTDILEQRPGHWPGANQSAVVANYTDPLAFIQLHRPQPKTG